MTRSSIVIKVKIYCMQMYMKSLGTIILDTITNTNI
jgi:hypothetical protein